VHRVAVDAMGGDHAPGEVIAGAVAAAHRGIDVVLVGHESTIRPLLNGADLAIEHADDVIHMGANAARALREQPQSSIAVASRLVASGGADALVSAGSTGAALAAAAILIGRVPGVLRPSIASVFPTPGTPTIVLDSGANPDCKPEHLHQFATMGSLLSREIFGVAEPRVGLLNIGEEEGKGRDLDKAAFELIAADSALRFIGNVEGRDVGRDACDVIVTDGFTGNVFLKTTEGAVRLALSLVAEGFATHSAEAQSSLGAVLGHLAATLDPDAYGGALLVGTAATVVIAHGSSSSRAITNAITMAADGAAHRIPELLAEQLVPHTA
jgi:glycerol-3-phosphate acyltransferase PlsX